MIKNAKWIWLDPEIYPEYQSSELTFFCPERKENRFAVAEFMRSEKFGRNVVKAEIEISADVKYWLYINGAIIGSGPVCAGGDYGSTSAMPFHYYNCYSADINSSTVDIYAVVQKNITVQCDMSQGRPGLIMSCRLIFDDGSTKILTTDEKWLARLDKTRHEINYTDFNSVRDIWHNAVVREDNRRLRKSPLKNLYEEEIIPNSFERLEVLPGETREVMYEFDKIYSGFYHIVISSPVEYSIVIKDYERYPNKANEVIEQVIGNGVLDFRGLKMTSVGGFIVCIQNCGKTPLVVDKISLIFCCYPFEDRGSFVSSEPVLNKIYEMGKWALRICRQTIELDSPKHQENLGCTGDYYISSLMNYFTDGDTVLSSLDIIRTADYLVSTDGYMFHTTYSMIWILMLYDYYMFSGNKKKLDETKQALTVLLDRFDGFCDERGIIVNPTSYMFVDWLEIDGISMHHPPMALGQSVLNAFYYGGLQTAVKIFDILGDRESAKRYSQRAERLKTGFNRYLYDNDRELYFDGLNEKHQQSVWVPENTDKRYFSWHTNSLAVLFDLAPVEKQKDIMVKILNDMTLINPQPYFMHFVLEAIYKADLFEEYGMEQLMRWGEMTEFEKGLQEGWYDISGYGFDYSHVWGGTPTYQLPSKLSGLEIQKPGFKKIRLKPRLFGLEYAKIKIPTPYGEISVNMEKGKNPEINIPGEIEAEIC